MDKKPDEAEEETGGVRTPGSSAPGSPPGNVSLEDVHGTIDVPNHQAGFWQQWRAYVGPAILVSVGYMDPGNWATDLAAGAQFKYGLLWVIGLASLMAIFMQMISARLGVVTGKDLAQCSRDWYPRWTRWPNWLFCELAIGACDLAEVLGSAVALNLMFHIPLFWAVIITGLDVMLLLALQQSGMRTIEAIVLVLVLTISGCYFIEIFVLPETKPHLLEMGRALVTPNLSQPGMLYVAIGIIGATVMPHNLYLHSSIVQTRAYEETAAGHRTAVKYAFLDSTVALSFALFINAAILIVAAATFHRAGQTGVAEIQEAYHLLTPLLGVAGSSAVFAFALLASGQNSTLTGTLAGQIVMEGFLNIRIRPWLRRLITRGIAIVPAALTAIFFGEQGTAGLLILSQVILSLQLSFAVFPLVWFTSDRAKMGEFVNPTWLKPLAYGVAVVIAGFNVWLLVQAVGGWLR